MEAARSSLWAVGAALVLGQVLCHDVQPRSDDSSPDAAIIQTLAAKLNSLEAELAAQKQKVTTVEAALSTQTQRVQVLEDQLNRHVAFTVQMNEVGHTLTVSEGAALPFDKVTLNIGNAYNPNTLSFTAPYAGNYWFYVRIDETDFRSFEIRRNGHALNRCDNDGGLHAITCGVVVSLKSGDTITVNHRELGSIAGVVDPGPESLFAGFLIQ